MLPSGVQIKNGITQAKSLKLRVCTFNTVVLVCYIKRPKSFFAIYFHDILHGEDTEGYMGLQGVPGGYKGLQGLTRGYRGLLGVTVGYKGLQGVTKNYRNLFSSYNVARYSFLIYLHKNQS